MRHLVFAAEHGLETNPRVVAELGPGDSLGVGLAAVLTGADRYYALDIVGYADITTNFSVLDGLLELLEARAPVPEGEFAATPILQSSDFPHDVLTERRLEGPTSAKRVAAVRAAIEELGTEHDRIRIAYAPSWMDTGAAPSEQPDMIFSQAVLEHVDDLEATYRRMYEWVPRGGVVSHEIDFTSHGFARTWDGHWTLSDRAWRAIRGRRRFAINRMPVSTHLELLETAGFRLAHVHRVPAGSNIRRDDLAPQFRSLSEDDLTTCSAVVQAVKD
jgi:hypothetical protein